MAEVFQGRADLALDEWISRIDHGSEASRLALDEVFRLFGEERNPRRVRRLTPALLVRRLAVYRLDALKTLHTRTWFETLPATVREFVEVAVREIARADSGEDDIPF